MCSNALCEMEEGGGGGEEGESSIVGSLSRALLNVEDDKSLIEDCQSAGGGDGQPVRPTK